MNDSVASDTVSLYAAHAKIYARAVKGRFVQWRHAAVGSRRSSSTACPG